MAASCFGGTFGLKVTEMLVFTVATDKATARPKLIPAPSAFYTKLIIKTRGNNGYENGMAVTADAVADATLQQFDKLPQRRKPQDRGNGSREWVPLSGIVAQGT
jgi:hypothetical protein